MVNNYYWLFFQQRTILVVMNEITKRIKQYKLLFNHKPTVDPVDSSTPDIFYILLEGVPHINIPNKTRKA